AYQGYARGLGEPDILTLNAWATQGLFPDLVLLLHVEPDVGLSRSAGEPDRIESEDAEFHAKVADAYLKIAEEHPERFVVIEGSGKRLAMRAFAAALLCANGGCGDCRSCRLALGERHPNMLVLEPTGPDILVGKDAGDPNTARAFARNAYLTPPEPGWKIMVV